MAPVIEEGLSRLPQADLQAIAVYLRSYHPETASGATAAALNAQAERQVEPLNSQGHGCFPAPAWLAMRRRKARRWRGAAVSGAEYQPVRRHAGQRHSRGAGWHTAAANAELGYMPGFRYNLDDAQIAILLNYLRQHYAGQSPWPDLKAEVGRLRAETAQK